MSKSFVTGASGFIGLHLVRALVERGDTVTCLVRCHSAVEPLKSLGVRLCVGDVTDVESLRGALAGQDRVYHLAGRVRARNARQFHAVNEAGVRAVAEACAAQCTPPVLLSVSSLAAAGPSAPNRPRTETDPPAPVSYYGRSKKAGEMAVAGLAHRLPATIVRPPIVFGEGDRMGLPLFASVARFRMQALPTMAHSEFSMVHVADLVQLLIAAAAKGQRLNGDYANRLAAQPGAGQQPAVEPADWDPVTCSQGFYYASGGCDLTLAEFSRVIARTLGRRRLLVVPVPSPVTWSVAALMELFAHVARRPVNLNLDKAREATAGCWTCCAQKAARQLNCVPSAPLEQRIEQTVEWYRNAQWI